MAKNTQTDIRRQISEVYPGVLLESDLQGWVYLEAFDKGIALYENLAAPSAADDRWLGVCYFQLFDDLSAVEAFHRAAAKGSAAAHINLAHAYIYIERSSDVLSELAKVNFDTLPDYDKVLYLRVKSYYEEVNVNLDASLHYAEEAWGIVQGIAELPVIAPQISTQLGILYARKGRAQRALWFIERSLTLSSGLEADRAQLDRAHLQIMLGHYAQAQTGLAQLDTATLPQQLRAVHALRLADISWAKGELGDALTRYKEATKEALDSSAVFEEFQARLALMTLLGKRGAFEAAHEHAARAKALISDTSDQMNYRFRAILLTDWTGQATAETSLEQLLDLAAELSHMGLQQERGWVRLHAADIKRRLNDDSYKKDLDRLQALAVSLQNSAFLAREWALLPELQTRTFHSHPKIAGKSPDLLEIYSLGEERLVLNGKIINIPLKKAVEIIVYFLEHDRVSLKKLLLDIFADENPKAARNYFHQLRHELRERLPSIDIVYSAEERVYTLKTEADILWDVAELRAGRKLGETGIFLPSSGSEWAAMLEHTLSQADAEDTPIQARAQA